MSTTYHFGPLLFLLYINDFQTSSPILSFILFADDSNIFFTHPNPNIIADVVNNELLSVLEWINANKLSLNVTKTNYMLFSNSITSLYLVKLPLMTQTFYLSNTQHFLVLL